MWMNKLFILQALRKRDIGKLVATQPQANKPCPKQLRIELN